MIDSGTLLQGRFLIEDKIGMGGMGAVYRAVDQKFGSQVAIKETFYGDSELSGAFEREARLLNSLHHPILPHVSDYFTENGGVFLVMEYIEGDDLSELLKRGEVFSPKTIIGWALEILDGLDYLHSQNPPVIHRDIKPNNLKLTSRGKIVLLDFGMAKETTGHTVGGHSVFGYSRRYSPLEQIEGTGTDARSDIFSLGATVYHLLTRQPPPEALARASAIVAGRPDPLLDASSINPDVSESVAKILNSALDLNANNRIDSARAMSSALRSAIEADPNNIGQTVVAGAGIGPVEERSGILAPLARGEISSPNTRGVVVNTEAASVGVSESLAAITSRSLPPRRIKRPVRFTYALGLPLVLLCLGLVLFGTYLGLQSKEDTEDIATEPVTNAAAELATDVPKESAEPAPATAVESVKQSGTEANKDARIAPSKVDSEIAPRSTAQPKETRVKNEPDPVRTNVRQEPTTRTNGQARPRRVVRPAFEQPSVSSIEALMTGVPNEGRRRSKERDEWTEDELRRRRQMRRQQRRQQPF